MGGGQCSTLDLFWLPDLLAHLPLLFMTYRLFFRVEDSGGRRKRSILRTWRLGARRGGRKRIGGVKKKGGPRRRGRGGSLDAAEEGRLRKLLQFPESGTGSPVQA